MRPNNSLKPWETTPAQIAPPRTRDLRRGLRQDPGRVIRDESRQERGTYGGFRLTPREERRGPLAGGLGIRVFLSRPPA